jgi:hypothetical protein
MQRTNSIYAVRVRFLESEVARLTTELLEKQEEVLKLQNQVDSLNEDPRIVRREIEVKLQELMDVVTRLPAGDMPHSRRRRKSPRREPLKRPERQTTEDDYIESRLPAISEEKQWPRLSLSYVNCRRLKSMLIML